MYLFDLKEYDINKHRPTNIIVERHGLNKKVCRCSWLDYRLAHTGSAESFAVPCAKNISALHYLAPQVLLVIVKSPQYVQHSTTKQ